MATSGLAASAECLVRVVGAYTVPVDTMVWVGTVMENSRSLARRFTDRAGTPDIGRACPGLFFGRHQPRIADAELSDSETTFTRPSLKTWYEPSGTATSTSSGLELSGTFGFCLWLLLRPGAVVAPS
ncbi:hypothetical protein [Streptomyces sp. NPDC058964]|uniref:hypothetical protein n=1 Tax=Streptomyces sp. NPDC058964 TaxID=3346681 RepID=UPI0036C13334